MIRKELEFQVFKLLPHSRRKFIPPYHNQQAASFSFMILYVNVFTQPSKTFLPSTRNFHAFLGPIYRLWNCPMSTNRTKEFFARCLYFHVVVAFLANSYLWRVSLSFPISVAIFERATGADSSALRLLCFPSEYILFCILFLLNLKSI